MRHLLVAIAVLAAATGVAATAGATRARVATLPSTATPRILTLATGGDFVFAGSGSSGAITVFDARGFDTVATALVLDSAAAHVTSLAASHDTDPRLIAGTSSGKLYVWPMSGVLSLANGGAAPATSDVFPAWGVGVFHPIPALTVDLLGSRAFPADGATDAVEAISLSTHQPISGAQLVGHPPRSPAEYVQLVTGPERSFYSSGDGTIPWFDSLSLTPGVLFIDAAGPLPGLAQVTFPSDVQRLAVVDAANDSLVIVDPAGPSIVTTKTLAGHPVAVAVSGVYDAAVIWVAEDTPVAQVEGFTPTLASAQSAVALSGTPVSLAEGDGWLYAGLLGGGLDVITDRPWVQITSVTPTFVSTSSQSVAVAFTSDQAGTSALLLNGKSIATGTVTAGGSGSFTITPATLAANVLNGENRLRVEVTSSTSLVGHDEAGLEYNLPPDAPRNFTVGFGDAKVIADWDPPHATDVVSYRVSFGTDSAGTMGVTGKTSPQTTSSLQYIVYVPNGTTVYMSVVALDSAGLVSKSTPVRYATAQPTNGAADLAGDKGGFHFFSCDVAAEGGAIGMGWLAAAALVLSWTLRRHRSSAR